MVLYSYLAEADSLSPKPVSMLDFMNVSVYGPVMEKCRYNFMAAKNAQTTSGDAREEIMGEWELLAESLLDSYVVILAPHFLKAHNVVVTMSKLLSDVFHSNIFVF